MTPDFIGTAASSFGDAAEANLLFTIRALFNIHAVRTMPTFTAIAKSLLNAIKAVKPFTLLAQVIHKKITIMGPTVLTVVIHAITAC